MGAEEWQYSLEDPTRSGYGMRVGSGSSMSCPHDIARNAVQYVLRNAERHGLHDAWPGKVGGAGKGTAALGMPRPDPLSTAAWFPYWAERELLVAPTQIPASVVRPAQCDLMKLAFEGAPLSFAAPMRRAIGMPRHRSKARAELEAGRGQERGTAPNRVARRRRECSAAAT
jgi:hypothetical protein